MPVASDIDFARRPRHLQISGWPLLGAAFVAMTAVGSWGLQARRDIVALDLQIAAFEQRSGRARPASSADPALEADMRAANEALDLIGIPWERLFGAVEGATMDGIHVLGVFPDTRAGTVQIRAETDEPECMFDYARRLAAQPTLSSVFLVEHRIDAARAPRSLQFVISASWLGKIP